MKHCHAHPILGRLPSLATGLLGLLALAQAQNVAFDSGSTGALGDVVITNNTSLLLPADGVLHYKSFTLKDGASVGFIKNAHNTPVYLLSQGDVVIEGKIYVSGGGSGGQFGPGLGGPGGFDGGRRGAGTMPPGDGQGPGGGRAGPESGPTQLASAGSGVFLQPWSAGSTNAGAVYGNAALIPLIGGSGGGGTPGYGGGGGGGAILIASNTKISMPDNGAYFIDATGGERGTADERPAYFGKQHDVYSALSEPHLMSAGWFAYGQAIITHVTGKRRNHGQTGNDATQLSAIDRSWSNGRGRLGRRCQLRQH